MDHNSYKELLSALLDGELNENERGTALAHLAECEACRTYFAELNAMRDALGGLDEVEPPEDFAAGVLARLHAEAAPQKAKKRSPWRGWGALAACAAVIVLAVAALPRMGGAKGAAPSSPMFAAPATVPAAPAAAPAAPAEASTEETDYGFAAANDAPAGADGALEMPEAWLESSAVAAPHAEEHRETLITSEASQKSTASGGELPAESAEPTPPMTAIAAEDAAYTLTLMGEGAAEWLEANAEPLGGGLWRVSVEAVNDLPDTLALVAVDGLQEPADGTLIITFGTPENPR